MKTYSQAPDVDGCIDKIQGTHHAELDGVSVSALFVFDDESSESVLKHQGYPAGAVVRITPLRDRTLGVADAVIVIDRPGWLTLSQRQRDALIDHELTHITRVLDKETGKPQVDAAERPKLAMRHHDHQFGWFDEVAQRHGEASPEVRQARHLMESSRQLYFEFVPREHFSGTLKDGTPFTAERTEAESMSNTGRQIQAAAIKAERKKRAAARDVN